MALPLQGLGSPWGPAVDELARKDGSKAKVLEDAAQDWGIDQAREHPPAAAAVLAHQDVDLEHPLHQFFRSHGQISTLATPRRMSIFRAVIEVTSLPDIRHVEEAETSCFFPYYLRTGVGRAANGTDRYQEC